MLEGKVSLSLPRDTVEVSPHLLQVLRESSGYTIDSLAKELKRTPREIGELEDGTKEPSVKLIHKLAKIYHRPLTIFFTKEFPKLPTITDYRINRDQQISPKAFLAERRAYYLAQRVSELTIVRTDLPDLSRIESSLKLAREFRELMFDGKTFQSVTPQKDHRHGVRSSS
jgi:transcriptional regulator with XRE-family HTH domain